MRANFKKPAGGRWRVTSAGHWLLITGHWSLITLILLALATGCRRVQSAVDVPGQAVRAVTPGKKAKPEAKAGAVNATRANVGETRAKSEAKPASV